MYGIKMTKKGDIAKASILDLVIDSLYPFWNCSTEQKPEHYGVLDIRVTGVPAFGKKTIFSIPHRYENAASFLAIWSYPPGTSPSDPDQNSTFGMGDFQVGFTGDDAKNFNVNVYVTSTEFIMEVDNTANSTALDPFNIKYRYYIFAQDFRL